MYTAQQIADYLILKSQQESEVITNKRLQKLLYYMQAWHLVINGKPLFTDKIEAWIHGPAISSIYETYKSYVAKPIDKKVDTKIIKDLGDSTVSFIDRIYTAYKKYDTNTLEFMTHAENPWQIARKGVEANESSSNEITLESMKQYYGDRLAEVNI